MHTMAFPPHSLSTDAQFHEVIKTLVWAIAHGEEMVHKTPEAEGMWYQISFKSAGSQDFLFFPPQDLLKQNFQPGLNVSRKMGQQNESECKELWLHSSGARAVGMGSPGQWYRGAPVRGPLLHIPWLACPFCSGGSLPVAREYFLRQWLREASAWPARVLSVTVQMRGGV